MHRLVDDRFDSSCKPNKPIHFCEKGKHWDEGSQYVILRAFIDTYMLTNHFYKLLQTQQASSPSL